MHTSQYPKTAAKRRSDKASAADEKPRLPMDTRVKWSRFKLRLLATDTDGAVHGLNGKATKSKLGSRGSW